MCGLFGAYGNLVGADLEYVKQLAIMSSLRGMDSTGVAVFGRHKGKIRYNVHREVGDPIAFLGNKGAKEAFKTSNAFLILGHSRYATSGLINVFNAHPICEKSVVGCHNGVIKKYDPPKGMEDRETDSRVLFRNIAINGLESTVEDVGYDGAYALTYVDLREGTFNIVRNSRRDLFIMYDRPRSCFYWASERGMLELLKERNGGEGNFNPVFPISSGTRWSFKMGSMDPNIQKVEPKPRIVVPAVTHKCASNKDEALVDDARYAEWLEGKGYTDAPWEEEKDIPLPEGLFGHDGTPLFRKYRAYGGELRSLTDAKRILLGGCAMCTGQPEITDTVYWVDDEEFLCEDCRETPFASDLCSQTLVYKGELCN